MANPPVRLVSFISEQEVEEIRKRRGDKEATESAVPDRPLFEILKENKDKQQAEFNERFKHRPPKALDEDETEFLDTLAKYKREQELQLANEEAQQLLNFQAAVASRTVAPEELTLSFHSPKEVPKKEKKHTSVLPTVKIKPQPKRPKVEISQSLHTDSTEPVASQTKGTASALQGLASYGSDSEDEEET